jgi:DNA-directed RNA polymerase specialized sigma24 family protein
MAQIVQIEETVANDLAFESPLGCAHLAYGDLLRLSIVLGLSSALGLAPGKGHMRRKGGQGRGKASLRRSAEQSNAAALQRVLENNSEELLWLAEVMAGSRPVGEQCLADAIQRAQAAQYVGQEWMLPWVKRLLVHVILKRISSDIRDFLPVARPGVILARAGGSVRDKQRLRSVPPQRIISSFDVLERACFILYVYLDYQALDCALLLRCPRAWVDSICEGVFAKIAAVDEATQNEFKDAKAFISPETERWAD